MRQRSLHNRGEPRSRSSGPAPARTPSPQGHGSLVVEGDASCCISRADSEGVSRPQSLGGFLVCAGCNENTPNDLARHSSPDTGDHISQSPHSRPEIRRGALCRPSRGSPLRCLHDSMQQDASPSTTRLPWPCGDGVRCLGRDRWSGSWDIYTLNGAPLPHDRCPMAVAIREDRKVRGVTAIAERPDGTRVQFRPLPTPLHDAKDNLVGAVNVLLVLGAA